MGFSVSFSGFPGAHVAIYFVDDEAGHVLLGFPTKRGFGGRRSAFSTRIHFELGHTQSCNTPRVGAHPELKHTQS